MANGFHPSGLALQPQATAIYATDPTTLIQHVQAPNLAAQSTILPHQRTDRLTVFSHSHIFYFYDKFDFDESFKNYRPPK